MSSGDRTILSSKQHRTAGATLVWVGIWYALWHIGFVIWADTFRPAVYDPEFAIHLAVLKARRTESPAQPLLVVIGSSHMLGGFRGERLGALTTLHGQTVMPYNMAHGAAGPIYTRLIYRRLVQENLVPQWLLVELLPLLMQREPTTLYGPSVVANEFHELRRYAPVMALSRQYAKSHLLPWQERGRTFLQLSVPKWLGLPGSGADDLGLDRLGGSKTAWSGVDRDAVQFVRALRDGNGGCVFPDFHADPGADAALRCLLAECRTRGIRVALLLAPVSPEYRLIYSEVARDQIHRYGRTLCRQFAAEWIDAQNWLPEGDFTDGHHVNLSGQAHFTDRLGEFLQAWVRTE